MRKKGAQKQRNQKLLRVDRELLQRQSQLAQRAALGRKKAEKGKPARPKESIQTQNNTQTNLSYFILQFLSDFERDLKREKAKQIEQMRQMMQTEKKKFSEFSIDDGRLEEQIMNIYKKSAIA